MWVKGGHLCVCECVWVLGSWYRRFVGTCVFSRRTCTRDRVFGRSGVPTRVYVCSRVVIGKREKERDSSVSSRSLCVSCGTSPVKLTSVTVKGPGNDGVGMGRSFRCEDLK